MTIIEEVMKRFPEVSNTGCKVLFAIGGINRDIVHVQWSFGDMTYSYVWASFATWYSKDSAKRMATITAEALNLLAEKQGCGLIGSLINKEQ